MKKSELIIILCYDIFVFLLLLADLIANFAFGKKFLSDADVAIFIVTVLLTDLYTQLYYKEDSGDDFKR